METYPLLGELYSLVKEFHVAIFSEKPEKLDEWIKSAQKHDIPELQLFVEGISGDLTAVKTESSILIIMVWQKGVQTRLK